MSSPTKRAGKEALYSFTPFKIQSIEHDNESYSLILTPLDGMNIKIIDPKNQRTKFEWKYGIIDKFKVQIPIRRKRREVLHPLRLYSKVFNRDTPVRYIFESDKDYRYSPLYIEFSYDSLKNGYYCKLGKLLVSSEKICPILNNCKYAKIAKGNCIYYSGPQPYTTLYTVFPYVISRYEEISMAESDKIITHPLFTTYYISVGHYVTFINGIYFIPKRDKDIPPRIVYLNPKIGYKINNVPAIKFEFDSSKLNELIRRILDNNDRIRKWIKMKYWLYVNRGGFNAYNSIKGFYAFKRLTDALDNTQRNEELLEKINKDTMTDEEIEFAGFLFLHSFAHIFLSWISAKYGYGKEGISYYIIHPLLKNTSKYDNKVAIYIFEEAVGGLGYLKSFKEEVKRDLRSFREFLLKSLRILTNCESKVENEISEFFNLLQNTINDTNASSNLKNVIKDINTAYKSLYGKTSREIYPHINSVRELISKKNIDSDTRAKLDDILESSPHCWDGCPLCVMLEKYCEFPIFNQPFLVSRDLTRVILEEIDIDILSQILSNHQNIEDQNIVSSKLKIREGYRFFKALLKIAKESIDLVSPWLSEQVLSEIFNTVKDNEKIRVRILTTDYPSETHQKSLKLLKEYIRENKNIEARVYKSSNINLHAKHMLVDGVLLMEGTVNFTKKGLTENIESARITKDRKEIKEFVEEFNSLWEKSTPLK